jgi:hypothetical protein
MAHVFSLEEAKRLMPRVRQLTDPVYMLASSLAEALQTAEEKNDEVTAEPLRERLQQLVESWTEAMQEMGGEVKGLWLVDFDSGDGYWCWAYPETELDHWHTYEAGFRGRMLIAEKPHGVQA